MMNNLFSIFDPISIMKLPLNWISIMLMFMFIPKKMFLQMNRINNIINYFNKLVMNEFSPILKKNKFMLLPMTFFTIILMNNLMSLPPYIFPTTSHLQLNMLMSLPTWLSIMMFGWYYHTNHLFCHLVPNNTPLMLMNFMVIIETISNLIRPLTLMVRLTANLIAGHLLLSLLSSLKMILSYKSMIMLIMIQMILITLEFSVAIIQAYVFSLLICLYFMDVN
uniref:ATP synthase subunit a n=1 Tax=Plectrocnemia tsukuiensis TaxID=623670 RepID=A0A9E8RSW8_9NEOP|nr:ATP synthase F0 subunit 6 [Plectrocnemia tsukuiensis]UZZ43692.1 ATP synthase F0 subunit 6 [Plectrocnemia tsukuiensis]